MAVTSSRARVEPLRQWRECRDRETSPGRTMVWKEPKTTRKVPVVYYLSRNGQLEHPHFMEVTLSSTDGLFLRDVIDRLNFLRGKGMAESYSWSSKRCYRNGYVWHDLSEDDLIPPAHGHEHVLMGSELLQPISFPISVENNAFCPASGKPVDIPKSVHHDPELVHIRRQRAPRSSFDLNEYKVYKTDLAADASTQTDEGRGRRGAATWDDRGQSEITRAQEEEAEQPPATELDQEEISPPPSSSSPATQETTLSKVDEERTVGSCASGRMRASAVLMHLLSCGSINVKGHHGFAAAAAAAAVTPQRRERTAAPRGGSGVGNGLARITLEDREYFSGSLIETRKKKKKGGEEFPGLKRSSSYNADRCDQDIKSRASVPNASP